MKAERAEQAFQPVNLLIETQDEMDLLYEIGNMSDDDKKKVLAIMHSAGLSLGSWDNAKYITIAKRLYPALCNLK